MPETKFHPSGFLPDLRYFVGREKFLDDLREGLLRKHRVSIHDIHGLGKTFSAQKYASLYRGVYKDIFFVNAAKEAWMESLAKLGKSIGGSGEKQEEQAMAFRHWLEGNKGWLVVYDNVDYPQALKPYLPNDGAGDCIFTSNFRAVENISNQKVEIDELEPEAARALLFAKSRNEPDKAPEFSDEKETAAFENIIEKIDGLPIALAATGAIIFRDQLSFSDFWEMLSETEDVVIEAEDEYGDYKHGSALRAFSIALDDITNAKSKKPSFEDKAVREMLNAACFLFPDAIPEEFLQAFLEEHLKGFDKSDKKQWIAIRNRFTDFDLFKYDKDSHSFSTHRLIQKCIFSRLGKIEAQHITKVLEALLKFFPLFDYSSSSKKACEAYYQHCVSAIGDAEGLRLFTKSFEVICFRLGSYSYDIGLYDYAEEFYTKNLSASKILYGESHEEVASGLNNLAMTLRSKNRFSEAIAMCNEALSMLLKIKGELNNDYAQIINTLALVYRRKGEFTRAIELFEKAKEIDRRLKGQDSPEYATRLYNLAVTRLKMGEHLESINLTKRAIEIDENKLGKNHPFYALDLVNLAKNHIAEGNHKSSLELLDNALSIFTENYPPEHPYIEDVKISIDYCKGMMGREGKETR